MDNNNKTNIRTAVILWLVTAGYMALIFFLSSRPLHLLPLFPGYFDKVIHVFAYMSLASMFFISLRKSGLNKYILFISFLLAGIYGITDEFHQSFVPGRDAAVTDTAADFIGAILGSFGASRVKF